MSLRFRPVPPETASAKREGVAPVAEVAERRVSEQESVEEAMHGALSAEEALQEARRKARLRGLLLQPAMMWGVLLLVGAGTGMLTTANHSIKVPILLHAVPQTLAFLAGYRLGNRQLGTLSGLSFHLARALLILAVAAGPAFMTVVRDYPGQLLWLTLLPPLLGYWGGSLAERRRRDAAPLPRRRMEFAAAAALIAATTIAISPRFLNPATFAPDVLNPPAPMEQANLPPRVAPAQEAPFNVVQPMTIGGQEYATEFQASPGSQAVAGEALRAGGAIVASANGQVTLQRDGGWLLRTQEGQTPERIARVSGEVNASLSASGRLAVWNEGGRSYIWIEGEGGMRVEDLLQREMILDPPWSEGGRVTGAAFNPASDLLEGTAVGASGEEFNWSLRLTPEGSTP